MPLSDDSGVDLDRANVICTLNNETIKTEDIILETNEFVDKLNKNGKYAILSLSAICLKELYGKRIDDREFMLALLKDICTTIKSLPQTLVCCITLLDENVPASAFIDLLLEQPVICEHGIGNFFNLLIYIGISNGVYDARFRVYIRKMAFHLRFPWKQTELIEDNALKDFTQTPHEVTPEERKSQAKAAESKKKKRYLMIGLATIGGGAILGLTGGLAAPLLAAGAGTVIGATGAAALASTTGVAMIGSLFGAAGAGLGGYKMNKRVGEIEEFEFEPLSEGCQLNLTIAIVGWLTDDNKDYKQIWLGLANSREQYVLKYESKYLLELGNSLDYLLSFALSTATQEILKYTVLSSLLVAVTWPVAAISAAAVIDNPWSICMQRAEAAGLMLANILLSRQQGKRPVTLIGFSLGARVIFKCLLHLSKQKNSLGIIEDIVILGAPVSGEADKWESISKVVAGRIVNGYCGSDWLLRYVYRTTNAQLSIAGLNEIDYKDDIIHNIDLSDTVSGHLDYMKQMDSILRHVGINTREYSIDAGNNSLQAWVHIQAKRNSPNHVTAATTSQRVANEEIDSSEEAFPYFEEKEQKVSTKEHPIISHSQAGDL